MFDRSIILHNVQNTASMIMELLMLYDLFVDGGDPGAAALVVSAAYPVDFWPSGPGVFVEPI